MFGASLDWRLSEHTRVSPHVFFGLLYWNFAARSCVAAGEPVVRLPARPHDPDELLYRVDFAEGEEQRCLDDSPRRSHLILPQVGVGVDIPIGSRVFARAEVRGYGKLPVPNQVRMGVGVRF